MYPVLTDIMQILISRVGGIVYYEDSITCMVKMNGVVIQIKRLSVEQWAVNSFSKEFFKIVDSQKPRCTFVCDRVELADILRRVSNATV
uniref:Uncharacterized protein n=1 Tax=Podoviridae sp. ctNY03 TaxID=2823558 RepID=A0A8S5LAH8_9CAUD|nr:MAG TPA: hypothetical protein [Podoviridae sp. ctNY03]